MADIVTYLTPVFRVSFPHVFTPQQYEGSGEPKFSLSAIWEPAKFTAGEKKLWAAIEAALDEEAKKRFKAPFNSLPANIKRGLRDGAEKADLEGYGAGKLFANLTSKMRPGVVNLAGEKIGPEHNNAELFYPGVYARSKVSVYSYDNKGKGIGLGLNNIQFIRSGARLDARQDAAADFAGQDVDESWLADDGDGDVAF